MPYTVHRQCACGRKYSHRSDMPDPGECPVCWDEHHASEEAWAARRMKATGNIEMSDDIMRRLRPVLDKLKEAGD